VWVGSKGEEWCVRGRGGRSRGILPLGAQCMLTLRMMFLRSGGASCRYYERWGVVILTMLEKGVLRAVLCCVLQVGDLQYWDILLVLQEEIVLHGD